MTLLDASALIALLRREPAGPEVANLLRDRECGVPAPCLGEVVDKMLRRHGAGLGRLSESFGALLDSSLRVLETDTRIAWRAGEIRAAHYRRKTAALSLADCVLLATAGTDDEIATADRSVAATARKLGIDLIPLPDSKGRWPKVD